MTPVGHSNWTMLRETSWTTWESNLRSNVSMPRRAVFGNKRIEALACKPQMGDGSPTAKSSESAPQSGRQQSYCEEQQDNTTSSRKCQRSARSSGTASNVMEQRSTNSYTINILINERDAVSELEPNRRLEMGGTPCLQRRSMRTLDREMGRRSISKVESVRRTNETICKGQVKKSRKIDQGHAITSHLLHSHGA
jgi:hypothetical protein